jgi:polar amino acid transport system permease protein
VEFLPILSANAPRLFFGAGVTTLISAFAILGGFISGLTLCLMRRSSYPFLRIVARCYISFFRGTPLLVQLLFLFFATPYVVSDTSPFLVAWIALSMNSAAFQAEILRGAFASIPFGQLEAATALRLSRSRTLITIELPQVLRTALPPLTNECVDVVKGSALVSVISVTELMRVTQQIVAVTVRPLEFYLSSGAIYLILTAVVSVLGNRLTKPRRLRDAP